MPLLPVDQLLTVYQTIESSVQRELFLEEFLQLWEQVPASEKTRFPQIHVMNALEQIAINNRLLKSYRASSLEKASL
jgi:hypothetical protein